MAHTKGNWEQVWNTKNTPETCIIKAIGVDGSKESICKIITNENDSDNAKLISASPELLKCCIYSLEILKIIREQYPDMDANVTISRLNEAIKNATL